MSDCADSARHQPHEPVQELAAILAAGVLRLRQLRARSGNPADRAAHKNSPKVAAQGLEVGPETVLSVPTG